MREAMLKTRVWRGLPEEASGWKADVVSAGGMAFGSVLAGGAGSAGERRLRIHAATESPVSPLTGSRESPRMEEATRRTSVVVTLRRERAGMVTDSRPGWRTTLRGRPPDSWDFRSRKSMMSARLASEKVTLSRRVPGGIWGAW